jgi:hypothetical protein
MSAVSEVPPSTQTSERPNPMNAAEDLFNRLLRERRLISYIDAHELLLGVRPSPFHNQVHCPPVIQAALQTAAREYNGLLIQLDALIVSQDRRTPGAGHYRGKSYTEAQWIQVFDGWQILGA